ncbi:MAG: NUDIX domain-containing protein [Firmicutes bacterium]|nr:NUDIX domain-containing protein [Bacillota bacterium]
MDIRIQTSDKIFHLVVRGIIKQDGKYLVMQVTEPDGNISSFHFPGGHVAFGETTEQAIKREIKEEVGCDIDVKLTFTHENFWVHNNVQYHSIEFYYLATPLIKLETKDRIVTEDDHGIIKKLDFRWLTPAELENFDVRPITIKNMVVKGKLDQSCHVINHKRK